MLFFYCGGIAMSKNDNIFVKLQIERNDQSGGLTLGIYFDKNPVDPNNLSPSLPDSDRLGFSIGAEAQITEHLGVSGSYLFIRSSELTVTDSHQEYTPGGSKFNGIYNASANLLSLRRIWTYLTFLKQMARFQTLTNKGARSGFLILYFWESCCWTNSESRKTSTSSALTSLAF